MDIQIRSNVEVSKSDCSTVDDFSSFYKVHVKSIYRFFYFKTGIKVVAEDLTSECFIIFIENLQKVPSDIQNPKAFLYGIAKNVFLDYLKKKYKTEIPASSLSSEAVDFIDNCVQASFKSTSYEDILIKYLPRIPKKQRQILSMRFLDKLSLTEITDELGKNMNYVKTTQKRAFASIRRAIELDGIDQNVH
jgi:RNA polymerase sigma-70 factor (ECF subfamily)